MVVYWMNEAPNGLRGLAMIKNQLDQRTILNLETNFNEKA